MKIEENNDGMAAAVDRAALRQFCLDSGWCREGDCLVLGGSAAKGGAYNDIDLLVLSRGPGIPTVLARVASWNGVRIELFHHTFATFAASIEAESRAGKFAKASLLKHGVVLAGAGRSELAGLFRLVESIEKKGPPPFNRPQSAYLFSQRLAEVRRARHEADRLASIMALANGFEQSFHLARGEWLLTGKHFLRDLQGRHQPLWSEFASALKEAIAGDAESLCAFIEGWFESACGPAPEGIEILA